MSTNSLPYILSSLLWIAPFGVWAQTPSDRTEAAAALDELYPQVKKRFSDRQYDEAAQLLAKASEWVHLYFDQDSEQYARKHYFEGALALYREDDKAAADHLLIAREGFTRLGSQPGLLMSSINNLAIAYKNLGLYAEAEPYYLESLSLRKSSNGTENPEYARALNNIGNLYLEMEDYKRAEASHLEAFAIRSRILPPDHEDYRQSKFNLANLYSDLGNFSKAEEMFLEILSKEKEQLGEDHPYNAITMDNLGNVYRRKGQYDKAEPYYLEAAAIRLKAFGPGKTSYIRSLINLLSLYNTSGDTEKGLGIWSKLSPVLADPSNLNKKQMLQILVGGGLLHAYLGVYDEAAVLLDSAMATNHRNWGTFQQALMSAKIFRTESAIMQGDLELAVHLSSTLAQETRAHLKQASRHLTAGELELYTGRLIGSQHLLHSVMHATGDPTLPADAYDNALFLNGLSLQVAALRRAFAPNDTLVQRLEASRRQSSQMLAKQYALPIPDRKVALVQQLEEEVSALEKALAIRIDAYGPASQPVNHHQVQRALRPGDAAIEIVRYPTNLFRRPLQYQYAALVLTHQQEGVLFIPLCEEQQLDTLLREAGAGIHTAGSLYASRSGELLDMRPAYGEALYKLLWHPLDSLLQRRGVRKVYLSSTGLLHQVAFRALPLPEKKGVLADRYAMRQVSSTRILVQGRDETTGLPASAVIFGGVDYNNASGDGPSQRDFTNMAGAPRPQRHLQAYGPDQQFSYLPGSLQEARDLEHILTAKGVPVRLFTGEDANEEQLKTVCGQPGTPPQLLHIATHGFYFEGSSATDREEGALGNPFAQQAHPLMRSGLALAGANRAWSGQAVGDDREDNIATAFEISQLDLTGTQLAVLSACGTGRGDIQGSEGIYGLQRGFKLAGARYLMLSLWSVPDRETAVFMQYFYRQWTKGHTLPDAFDKAQKKMRKRYKAPEYWAAWILLE